MMLLIAKPMPPVRRGRKISTHTEAGGSASFARLESKSFPEKMPVRRQEKGDDLEAWEEFEVFTSLSSAKWCDGYHFSLATKLIISRVTRRPEKLDLRVWIATPSTASRGGENCAEGEEPNQSISPSRQRGARKSRIHSRENVYRESHILGAFCNRARESPIRGRSKKCYINTRASRENNDTKAPLWAYRAGRAIIAIIDSSPRESSFSYTNEAKIILYFACIYRFSILN